MYSTKTRADLSFPTLRSSRAWGWIFSSKCLACSSTVAIDGNAESSLHPVVFRFLDDFSTVSPAFHVNVGETPSALDISAWEQLNSLTRKYAFVSVLAESSSD